MSLCRPGRDRVPMTYAEADYQPYTWVQDLNRGNSPHLVACLVLPCLIPMVLWSFMTIIKATIKKKKQLLI
jgi:hypothetical protein